MTQDLDILHQSKLLPQFTEDFQEWGFNILLLCNDISEWEIVAIC